MSPIVDHWSMMDYIEGRKCVGLVEQYHPLDQLKKHTNFNIIMSGMLINTPSILRVISSKMSYEFPKHLQSRVSPLMDLKRSFALSVLCKFSIT